jgi:hypothetical protein
MDVVLIDAGSQDLHELSQCLAPFRKTVFVRRQIARNDVWTKITSIGQTWSNVKREGCKEVRASRQVSGRVGFFRPLEKKVRVVTRQEIEIRSAAGGVAEIAIRYGVYPIAAQTYKIDLIRALSRQIELNRRDLNPCLILHESSLSSCARPRGGRSSIPASRTELIVTATAVTFAKFPSFISASSFTKVSASFLRFPS